MFKRMIMAAFQKPEHAVTLANIVVLWLSIFNTAFYIYVVKNDRSHYDAELSKVMTEIRAVKEACKPVEVVSESKLTDTIIEEEAAGLPTAAPASP